MGNTRLAGDPSPALKQVMKAFHVELPVDVWRDAAWLKTVRRQQGNRA